MSSPTQPPAASRWRVCWVPGSADRPERRRQISRVPAGTRSQRARVGQAGEFDDVGAVAQAAVAVECRHPSRTRQAVGSEATGPNESGCCRNTAKSAMDLPPSAITTARSTATRPGSCAGRRARSLERNRCQRGFTSKIGEQPNALRLPGTTRCRP